MHMYPCTALLVLTSFFAFPYISNAQATFVSDSLSVSWEQLDGPSGYVFKYAAGNGRLFAGTEGGLYYSTDGGENWKFNQVLGKHKLLNMFVKDNVILVLARRQIIQFYTSSLEYKPLENYAMRSVDGGNTWQKVFDTDDWPGNGNSHAPKSTDIVLKGDSTLYLRISTNGQSNIWTSSDLGESWLISSHNYDHYLGLMNVRGATTTLSKADQSTVWKGLIDTSQHFNDLQTISLSSLPDIEALYIRSAYDDGTFFIFLSNLKVYKTSNFGSSWDSVTLQISGVLKDIVWAEDELYFHTTTGVWRGTLTPLSSTVKIYNGEYGTTANATTFSITESGYWINNNQLISLHSSDFGLNWTERSHGLMSDIAYIGSLCGKLATRSPAEEPYAFIQNLSNTQDGEWTSTNMGISHTLGDANGYSYVYGPPFMRTSNCGTTWDTIENANILAAPAGLVQTGNRMYLWNKFGAPISFSDDYGLSWTEIQAPFEFADCISFQATGDTLFFLTRIANNWTLFRSFNIGQLWQSIPLTQKIGQLFWNEKKQLVGIEEGGASGNIFLSLDFGSTWLQTFSTDEHYPYIADFSGPRIRFPLVSEGMILMQAAEGVYVSHNEGLNWTRLLNLPFFNFTFNRIIGQNPTIGGYSEGARFYHANDGYLYAATEAHGIWRTELAPIRDYTLVKGAKYGFLTGQLYRDLDNTCDYNTDNGDIPLGHKPLLIQPGSITAVSDANGKYSVALPPGNYSVGTLPPTYHTLGCAAIGQSFTVSIGATTDADLVFQPQPGIKDLCVIFTTPVRARPGFPVNYTIQVSNVGTATVSGALLAVYFDAQWLEPSSISPSGQYVGNQAIIPISDLAPGQVIIFTLNFSVSVNTPIGTNLGFTALCPVAEDAHPANNRAVAIQTVTGSYDPNDKTAQPVQPQLPFQPRTFDYLIRFQNTGTDTAFTVVVTDTLDDKFNLMTIRTLESSHEFEFRLLDGRVAKWIFRDILLPDSNINEVASHGYIRFQIETNSNALPGLDIANDADIFFDFNSPIRTNESLAENPKWLVVNSAALKLCEGDVWNGLIWEQNATLTDTIGDAWSDTVSITAVEVSAVWQINFDTLVAYGQTFLGHLISQDTTITLFYQTAEGCDSTILWHVLVQTSKVEVLMKDLFEFELFPNPSNQETWIRGRREMNLPKMVLSLKILDTRGVLYQAWDSIEMNPNTGIMLDTSDLPGGIYFIQIQSGQGQQLLRLVKI
jgi:photosystem II stability/assembly factor-like uncharacterized protein